MIVIDPRSRTPIYEQICESVEKLILSGYFAPDEQLPSVRSLARELAINPNTIAKAYQQLESQGLTYSLPGRGSFIRLDPKTLRDQRQEDCFAAFDQALDELWLLKTDLTEVLDHVRVSHQHYYQGGEISCSAAKE